MQISYVNQKKIFNYPCVQNFGAQKRVPAVLLEFGPPRSSQSELQDSVVIPSSDPYDPALHAFSLGETWKFHM